MVVEMNYNYDTKHKSNILMAGTGCRKTTLVKNLEKNKMFDNIKKVIWASKKLLSKEREEQIKNCFVDDKVDF